MGEPDFDVSSQESLTADDIADVLASRLGAFIDDRPLHVATISLDANATFNLTLINGQTFRISVEDDNMERTGT